MKTRLIRNVAISLAAVTAIGVSTAQASLTVTPYGESAVAGTLRTYSKTDWANVNTSGSISVGALNFSRNDLVDNVVPFTTFDNKGASLTIEELFSDAGFTNELRIQVADTFLMTSMPDANTEGVMIKSNAPSEDLTGLVFLTNTAGAPSASAAGDVHLYDDANLRTYVSFDGTTTHYVWALEDISESSAGNDHDYNDYVFYAKLSAVPEPSTVISGIAVAFLGLTVLRRRLSEKKAVV